MKKNRIEDIEIQGFIRYGGNWNHRNNSISVCSKPMAIVKLGNDEFVWTHKDIMELIKLYVAADNLAIEMINSEYVDTGDVTKAETPLKIKLIEYIQTL